MRRILIGSFIFFSFFVYGLLLSQYDFDILRKELKPENPAGFYDYRGITHVHTDLSSGSGTYQDVIAAGQDAGLDFLIFTDHNHFNRRFEIEGYHRKLLVFVGGEYSYLDSRILLYDYRQKHLTESLGQTQVLLADLLSQTETDAGSELVVLAHPFKPGYSWSGHYPVGLDGIEVINLKTIWQNSWFNSKLSFLWSFLAYPFNSRLALLRLYVEPREELRLWDELNSPTRSTFGFAGSDATARTGSVGSFHLKFPSYQTSFSIATNHVLLRSELTGDAESDSRKIFEALRDGQFYMSLDMLADPRGFAAYLANGDKQYPMGSKVKWSEGLKLRVHLPQKPNVPFETAIIRNGEHVMSSNSADTEMLVHGPGVYRVVVRVIPTLPLPDGKKWISWIYSNPFFVQ